MTTHGLFNLTGQDVLQLEELSLSLVLSALDRARAVNAAEGSRPAHLHARRRLGVPLHADLEIRVRQRAGGRPRVLDPSRIAAQIVSSIGFIGVGVIFMRHYAVRGLTTAASVWLTAAIGMACGAGLPLLAVATMLMHVVIMFMFPKVAERLPRQAARSRRCGLPMPTGAACCAQT